MAQSRPRVIGFDVRKISLHTALGVVLIILTFKSISLSAVLPPGNIEYQFIYDIWERTEVNRFDRFDYQLGPYRLDSAKFSAGPFDCLRQTAKNELSVFALGGESIRTTRGSGSSAFESVRGGVAGQLSKTLFIYSNFLLDGEKADDKNYYGKKWRGLAGGVENAFVRYQTNSFDLTAGRFASFWGQRNSLVLTPGITLDGLAYTYRLGRLALSYRLARLDGLSPERDGVDQYENRYLAGHRLDAHLGHGFRVGVFETVIFGGAGRSVDFFYLNPIIFFHSSQLNEGMDDNTFLGFDFTYKPTGGLKIYGQLLVDDFQIENELPGDQEPNEIALQVGVYKLDVIAGVDIRAEYERVTNRTFNQIFKRNRYLYHGQLISAARGNDYDKINLSADRWLSEFRLVTVNLSYLRQGEGRVLDDWAEPWLDTTGTYSEPFPTGTAWKTLHLSAGFKGFISGFAFTSFEAGIELHQNYLHINGQSKELPFANLKISLFIFSPVSIK